MNDNKICNPKTEVPKGLELNDKDYVESILTVCKDAKMRKKFPLFCKI